MLVAVAIAAVSHAAGLLCQPWHLRYVCTGAQRGILFLGGGGCVLPLTDGCDAGLSLLTVKGHVCARQLQLTSHRKGIWCLGLHRVYVAAAAFGCHSWLLGSSVYPRLCGVLSGVIVVAAIRCAACHTV